MITCPNCDERCGVLPGTCCTCCGAYMHSNLPQDVSKKKKRALAITGVFTTKEVKNDEVEGRTRA
jgi:hypothetical protein